VDSLNNTFSLDIIAGAPGQIPGRGRTGNLSFSGIRPTSADIILDDNGQDVGWYFDPTPFDDAEFTAIANSGSGGNGPSFHASFVDIAGGFADFYRTITHEIGHALGLDATPVFVSTNPLMTFLGTDPLSGGTGNLYSFHDPTGQYGVTAIITTANGRHLYEVNHPNDLMNHGRTTPVGNPGETVRQLISDFDVKLLADAYKYGVVLPSTFNSAHVTLDWQTGTLLVQGGVNAQGQGQNDTISVTTEGANIKVVVNTTTERIH
jgi:hypothetical protein